MVLKFSSSTACSCRSSDQSTLCQIEILAHGFIRCPDGKSIFFLVFIFGPVLCDEDKLAHFDPMWKVMNNWEICMTFSVPAWSVLSLINLLVFTGLYLREPGGLLWISGTSLMLFLVHFKCSASYDDLLWNLVRLNSCWEFLVLMMLVTVTSSLVIFFFFKKMQKLIVNSV